MDIEVQIVHVWEPVDSITMVQRAELNDKKAQTGKALIEAGVLSPDEERNRVRDDKHSGYNRLQDDDANDEPGMSPENLAKFEKVDADKEKANAAQVTAGARETVAEKGGAQPSAGAAEEEAIPYGRQRRRIAPAATNEPFDKSYLREVVRELLSEVEPHIGVDIDSFDQHASRRSTSPGVKATVRAGVDGPASILGEMPAHKLPKMKFDGLSMTIENPRGTIRQGQSLDGSTWSQKMPHHYGFIRGTNGADDEEMDCFIGPNKDSKNVFVVNQNVDGVFDEHKCMLGFDTAEEAEEAYRSSFSADWQGFDSITPIAMDAFKTWLKSGDCYSPLSAACINQTSSAPQTDSKSDVIAAQNKQREDFQAQARAAGGDPKDPESNVL